MRFSVDVSSSFPGVSENPDAKTRTIKVRLEIDNAEGELKAEMLASVVLSAATRAALVVPEDAVVETGKRVSGQTPAGLMIRSDFA